LRKALGDGSKNPRIILTVSGRGYQFIAQVREIIQGDKILDESVLSEDGQVQDPEFKVQSSNRKLIWVAAPLVLLLIFAGYWFYPTARSSGVREIKTVAILPFQNIGGRSDEEYLGQGLAEVLISKLSNIKTIIVRPNSAVLKYSDASPDPVRIGSELEVEAILMGRVQKIDENIRVTVQLVRVSDGGTLWAETFDDKFTNVFALQDSIAEQVTNSLLVTLTTGERQQIAKQFTTDTQAFQLYLQGRYFSNKRTTDSLQKAIELYTQAINEDPNFARAYSGLADSYMLLGISEYIGLEPRDAIAKGKEAANRAIALDDSLAEAHASLGFMAYNYDFDWVNAEKQFRRAIELNPNYPTAHHWYSQFLNVLGRFDESETEIKKALRLDPSSLIINTDYASLFYYSRRYEQAIAQYKKTLELEPRFALAHLQLGRVYAEQKRFDEAIVEINQAIELDGRTHYNLALLGYTLASLGRTAEAEKILSELEGLGKQTTVLPSIYVRIYIGLRNKQKAMEWMERNYHERQPALIVLGIEPLYDFLRDEPRFQAMLKELKLNNEI
jgi:TolB-like protein/Flp pilus assembly protein TadD